MKWKVSSWCLASVLLGASSTHARNQHGFPRATARSTSTSRKRADTLAWGLHPPGILFRSASSARCSHRSARVTALLPASLTNTQSAHRSRAFPTTGTATSGTAIKHSASPVVQTGTASGGGEGGVTLWLDMRTAVLPAAQTLMSLYGDLRQREEALGRTPDDPDWTLSRVPNPVGALLYAAEPAERAAEEMRALGGGGEGEGAGAALPCFRLGNTDPAKVVDVLSGAVAGVVVDPAGANPAADIVAAAQRAGCGDLVLLRGLRPSVWDGGDMGTVLKIAASACAGAGKTLVVSVRSVGQLHDAAMAALAAAQTQVLGGVSEEATTAAGAGGESGTGAVALLIEPVAELWEAGLLYL